MLLSLVPLLVACGSSEPTIEVTDLDGADAAACRDLVAELPDSLSGQPRREVSPDDAPGAAWGDPAYVLTCGVPRPEDYEPAAECSEVGGVGWFVPADQLSDPGTEVVATALSHTPYVELRVPPPYRTDGLDAALAELAPVIAEHLSAGESCL